MLLLLLALLLIVLWLIVPTAISLLLPRDGQVGREAAASLIGIAAWVVLAFVLQPISFYFHLDFKPPYAVLLVVATVVYAVLFALGLERRPRQMGASGHSIPRIGEALLVPIDEELLFRGIVLGLLVRDVGALPGLLASSVLFAGVHELARLGGVRRNWRDSLADVIFGLLAALLYTTSGSILAPIALHAAINGFSAWTNPPARNGLNN